MASKISFTKPKNKFLATLVTGKKIPCAFCQREIDDELTYGKLYAIGDVQVHYFCVLLSCCLVQKGRDTEGLFGFLYSDIIAEVERSKKHKCSYCGNGGAALGCCVAQCRKQFHLPCGREKNVVSLFYGNYKSYCQLHAPKQKIPNHIMEIVRIRKKKARNALRAPSNFSTIKELCKTSNMQVPSDSKSEETESVCVICYEAVDGFPTVTTFWPPCCARDAWFHRSCLQRMALSAGMHYLKCPLCNDKEQFYDAVVSQGYYVPDRDAAWELEQNAFAEIYERPSDCSADVCKCPIGRAHDAENGEWDIKLCILCGTSGCHTGCLPKQLSKQNYTSESPRPRNEKNSEDTTSSEITSPDSEDPSNPSAENEVTVPVRYVCAICTACAPDDLDSLVSKVEAVMVVEQRRNQRSAQRTIMPSRMSLRRTKARIAYDMPSTSQNDTSSNKELEHERIDQKSNIHRARQELNLKPPRKPSYTESSKPLRSIENSMLSPVKLFQEKLYTKFQCMDVKRVNPDELISKLKDKLSKPRPLSVKKRIVDNVLEKLFDDILMEKIPKQSPKKAKEEIIEKSDQKTTSQTTPEKLPNGSNLVEASFLNTETDFPENDESSSSTFQLPPEFIAEQNSEDSFTLFETPKKLTTVDIQKDSSLEISENDKVINIDVVKMEENGDKDFIKVLTMKNPGKIEKCALKFNPKDKEALQEEKVDIDLECFKNQYLNEIGKDFKCNFSHNHGDKVNSPPKLRTAIDFAFDAFKKEKKAEEKRKKLKRKQKTQDGAPENKKKKQETQHDPPKNKKKKQQTPQDLPKKKKKKQQTPHDLPKNKKKKQQTPHNLPKNKKKKQQTQDDATKSKKKKIIVKRESKKSGYIKLVYSDETNNTSETLDLTVERPKGKNKENNKKKLKRQRDDIQVKIRFREKRLKLKITQSQKLKEKKKKITQEKPRCQKLLSQYILNVCGNLSSPSNLISKPEHEIIPLHKKKYVKHDISPDNLVQTSIQSFFKKLPSTEQE